MCYQNTKVTLTEIILDPGFAVATSPFAKTLKKLNKKGHLTLDPKRKRAGKKSTFDFH